MSLQATFAVLSASQLAGRSVLKEMIQKTGRADLSLIKCNIVKRMGFLILCLLAIAVVVFIALRVRKDADIALDVDSGAGLTAPYSSGVEDNGASVPPHIAWAQSAVKPLKTENPPQSLRGVMGDATVKTYGTRIKAVHALHKNLSEDERDALYAILYDKGGLNMRQGQMHAFKNDIANILGSQEEYPKDLAAHLILMHEDRSQDDVWRDYCIQHLSGCLQRSKDPEEQAAILETFWKATEENRGGIAGTAIISLRRSVDHPAVDKAKVAARALEMVNDPECGHLAKISALQMCAELGEKGLLPVAREIADSGAGVPLRMSSIAAIGTVGDKDDRMLLEKYAASSDARLRTAARSALDRLGER